MQTSDGVLRNETWGVPGDYDGDDKTDFALAIRVAYSNRTFLTIRPSGGAAITQNFPGLGDIEKGQDGVLAIGDYDYDWRTDYNAIFDSTTAYPESYFRGVTSSGYRFGHVAMYSDFWMFRNGDYPLAVGNVRRLYCRELCDTVAPWWMLQLPDR